MKTTVNTDLVSIVVPAYNVSNYIIKCLESIQRQSYTNIEVIVVNDGSTDDTEEKCITFVKEDKRFHLLNKLNGGLSSARNFGIKYAKGSFITFVDSDDYIEKNYISDLFFALKNNKQCQISMSPIRWFFENEIIGDIKTCLKYRVLSSDDAIKVMMLRQGYTHCAYAKMYHISYWKDFYFPDGKLYEDYLTTYKVFSKAQNIALVNRIGYNYLQRSNSIMHMKLSKKALSIIDISDEVTSWISQNKPHLLRYAQILQMANYLKIYQRIINSESNCHQKSLDTVDIFLKKNGVALLWFRDTPLKDKVKLTTYLISKDIFIYLYNKVSRV